VIGGLLPANTQCASGLVSGNTCGGRSRGGLCVADSQCIPGITCNVATGRCGQLLGLNAAVTDVPTPRDPLDPNVFRQCRSNGFSGDLCEGSPGDSAGGSASRCASQSLSGNNCALSEPGEICGADADCATGLGCNIEERRCVAHANAAAGTTQSCASGILAGANCQAGQRGDACTLPTTSSGAGTCATGLLCLDRICR
jgi:hypothetical protein